MIHTGPQGGASGSKCEKQDEKRIKGEGIYAKRNRSQLYFSAAFERMYESRCHLPPPVEPPRLRDLVSFRVEICIFLSEQRMSVSWECHLKESLPSDAGHFLSPLKPSLQTDVHSRGGTQRCPQQDSNSSEGERRGRGLGTPEGITGTRLK